MWLFNDSQASKVEWRIKERQNAYSDLQWYLLQVGPRTKDAWYPEKRTSEENSWR